jgi:peptide/nickel transport system substrate-binding protein
VAAFAQLGRGPEGNAADGGTFAFAVPADPTSLDPAFATDGESLRVARQIFEGLVGVEAGTADPAPGLAHTWQSSEDGLTHTFLLRPGVRFHDGTELDADAVCANFERWHRWTGLQQASTVSYYYRKVFGGFAESADEALEGGLYDGCEAHSETEVTITLTAPFSAFIQALSLPAFAIQSPAAMQRYGADEVTGSAADPVFGAYATAHPTGTGPFTFNRWEPGRQVVLDANEEYWGDPVAVDQLVLRIIPDATDRRQALRSGGIDGYDVVAPEDIVELEGDGYQLLARPPFTILYLGMNQAIEALQDERVRQAIAHAVDKESLVESLLPPSTEVATQFVPPAVNGHAEDVPTYAYDPARARDLLADAGYTEQDPLQLAFWYPTGASRAYLPVPERTFAALRADLQRVGIVVEAVPVPWGSGYLDAVRATGEDRALHLLGWTGDYGSTDTFLGVFFGAGSTEWGFADRRLFAALTEARTLPLQEQAAAYQEISREVMELLPGVPLAHPTTYLVLHPRVQDYPTSPVQHEVYDDITLADR